MKFLGRQRYTGSGNDRSISSFTGGTTMKRLLSIAVLLALAPCIARAAEPLVVHEWGTFTALQDEQGTALGRINTDDEPVPSFVHVMPGAAAPFSPTAAAEDFGGKSSPIGDTNITM